MQSSRERRANRMVNKKQRGTAQARTKGKTKASNRVDVRTRSANKRATGATTRKGPAALPSTARNKPNTEVSIVSSKARYKGPLFTVYTDQVREPNGVVSRRDVIRHGGSVVVLAVGPNGNRRDPLIVLERQYRHAAGRYMWEVPAGHREPEENPLVGAKRELLEETGYRAKRWRKLAFFYASPGFLGEWMQIYLAEELRAGESRPEDDECIEWRLVPLSEALQWVADGRIIDAKSMIAILLYHRRLSGQHGKPTR